MVYRYQWLWIRSLRGMSNHQKNRLYECDFDNYHVRRCRIGKITMKAKP